MSSLKDPAVASVIAYIGPGGATVTENDGRMFITLKPHGRKDRDGRPGDRAAQPRAAADPGHHGSTCRPRKTSMSARGCQRPNTNTRLVDVDSDELDHWAPILLEKLQGLPSLTDVASDQQSAGRTINIEVDRDVASRLGVDPALVDQFSTTLSVNDMSRESIRRSISTTSSSKSTPATNSALTRSPASMRNRRGAA